MPLSTIDSTGLSSPLTGATLSGPTISGAVVSAMASSVITSGTAVASTSGTSITFSSIPIWVKRITVMVNGIKKSSTANFLFQLGSGSTTTSGYIGNATASAASNIVINVNSTSGFPTAGDAASTVPVYGTIVLTLITSNTWIANGLVTTGAGGYSTSISGTIALSGVLDRVVITTTSGTDTFTAGSINILYE